MPEEADDVEDPDDGLDTADFLFRAMPYILTERRRDGRRGNRDCTAEGSNEYSIEGSLVRGKKSDRGRLVGGVAGFRWRSCAIVEGGLLLIVYRSIVNLDTEYGE